MESLDRIFEIARLVAKEKTDVLSDSENEILHNWLTESDNNRNIYKILQDHKKLINELNELKKFDEIKAFQKVERIIGRDKKTTSFLRFVPNIVKYAAAVAVVAGSSYFVFSRLSENNSSGRSQITFLPGKQKAILITKNQEVILDSTGRKQIINDDLATIVNSGSTLSYNKNDSVDYRKDIIEYNTLVTSLGGEYTLILSDSTQVILNSGSKLKYPVVFNSESREVELDGEAFFKVTKSLKEPFIVKTNNINVNVYGTTFNVSAYNNDNQIKTTLIEGSVGVSINNHKSESEIKIIAGQQLKYDKGTGSIETEEVNTEQFIAWTKGRFIFENEPIENILKVLSRWYDFNFEFKDESIKNQRFTISIGRNDNFNKILEMISISSKMKFSTKGNSIIVYSD